MDRDPHSFSRPHEVVVKHLDLDLNVNFDTHTLAGLASLRIENRTGADSLILDTRGLDIAKVTLGDNETETGWTLSEPQGFLGQALRIAIKHYSNRVNIHYTVPETAGAMQWLEPAQTAGGKQPFLFTQNQPILARSWIPCQDTPGVRMTYNATVQVPADLMAVMSASNPTGKSTDGKYRFEMPQPVPSYLIALAVGDLAFSELGARSGVYAEPSVVDAAAKEFEDTEAMINVAEELYGPYRWQRYDILVLPPSFPFGGMENPRLTFATPTILAGDKSLTALIAHELAHSWSGNLVTNSTWNDVWINEGFTTYFEYRIMEAVQGREYVEMLMQLDYDGLLAELAGMGESHQDTRLHLELDGRDPDAGMSSIAYDKGALFLRTLEEKLGRAKWDNFLRDYFETYAFKPMNAKRLLVYLESKLVRGDAEMKSSLGLEDWIYRTGLPADHNKVASTALKAVDQSRAQLLKSKSADGMQTTGWTTHHWRYFLNNLPRGLDTNILQQLDNAHNLTQTGNSEVLFSWLMLAVSSRYYPAYLRLETFLTEMGRRKFLRPLYRELAKTPEGLAQAERIFSKARSLYHPIARESIDAVFVAARK